MKTDSHCQLNGVHTSCWSSLSCESRGERQRWIYDCRLPSKKEKGIKSAPSIKLATLKKKATAMGHQSFGHGITSQGVCSSSRRYIKRLRIQRRTNPSQRRIEIIKATAAAVVLFVLVLHLDGPNPPKAAAIKALQGRWKPCFPLDGLFFSHAAGLDDQFGGPGHLRPAQTNWPRKSRSAIKMRKEIKGQKDTEAFVRPPS